MDRIASIDGFNYSCDGLALGVVLVMGWSTIDFRYPEWLEAIATIFNRLDAVHLDGLTAICAFVKTCADTFHSQSPFLDLPHSAPGGQSRSDAREGVSARAD